MCFREGKNRIEKSDHFYKSIVMVKIKDKQWKKNISI